MSGGADRLFAVVGRELSTVVRTRAFLVLGGGFAAVVTALAWSTGPVGYTPHVLELLTPVEVLVPALALALGYRSVLGDAERGELDLIRSSPVSRATYVGGVYLGRAAALLVAVLVPLFGVAGFVVLSPGTKTSVIASHSGLDSPVLYVRFVFLTAVFALVVMAAAVAVSAAARSTRAGLAMAVALGVALVLGFDAGIVAGLSGGMVSAGAIEPLLAFSPNSAYRGLVLDVALSGVSGGVDVSPAVHALGLAAWFLGSLAVATLTAWPTTWT
jgi:ABC-type transport system involved in multi-copper enzyme maturation permease subunit